MRAPLLTSRQIGTNAANVPTQGYFAASLLSTFREVPNLPPQIAEEFHRHHSTTSRSLKRQSEGLRQHGEAPPPECEPRGPSASHSER